LVKSLVPTELENQYRACVMSALRKVILEDDHSFGLVSPAALKNTEGIYDTEAVCHFISQNWKQLGGAAWEIQKQRFAGHMGQKDLKRKAGL
jgi:hypothetical protein